MIPPSGVGAKRKPRHAVCDFHSRNRSCAEHRRFGPSFIGRKQTDPKVAAVNPTSDGVADKPHALDEARQAVADNEKDAVIGPITEANRARVLAQIGEVDMIPQLREYRTP